MTHTLVVAHYNEDLSWLKEVPSHWLIQVYSKSQGVFLDFNLENLEIGLLPNQGREGETYLHHLIHYRNLASVTAFVQGNPFDHVSREEFFRQLARTDLDENSCVGLGTWLHCTSTGIPHHPGLNLSAAVMEFAELFSCCEGVSFVAGAQYIVGRNRLKTPHADTYAQLRTWLLEDEAYGYVLERFWPQVFTFSRRPRRTCILYYSHATPTNGVLSETIRREVIAQIDSQRSGMSDVVAVVPAECPQDWVPDEWQRVDAPEGLPWNESIYESIRRGLQETQPYHLVFMAEHDVLYPSGYWESGMSHYRPGEIGYFGKLYLLNALGYWTYHPSGFQSTCYGERDVLLAEVNRRLEAIRAGNTPHTFDFGKEAPGTAAPIAHFCHNHGHPVLDIRHRANTTATGTFEKEHVMYRTLPYWGDAQPLIKQLGLTETHQFQPK